MWGRIGTLASAIAGSEEEVPENSSGGNDSGSVIGSEAEMTDIHIQIMEQEKMILQFKEMIRDREKVLSEKDGELKKVNAEMSKAKLQFKSKVASLTKQLALQQKSPSDAVERASVGSDESVNTLASESTATGDHASRARQTLLRKQLKDKDKQLAEKEVQLAQLRGQLEVKERVIAERDLVVNDTKSRLAECELQIAAQSASLDQLREALKEASGTVSEQDLLTKLQLQVRMDEMLAQMVYKDSRTIELDSEIQQLTQMVMDLKENIAEKDEVIRGRDQAIQIIQAAFAERTAERDRLQSESESKSQGGDTGNQPNRDGAFQEVIDSLQERLLRLSEELAARDKSLQQVSAESLQKDQSLADLSAQLKDLEQKFALSEQNCFTMNQSYAELYQNYSLLSHNQRTLEEAYGAMQREHQLLGEQQASAEGLRRTLQQQLEASQHSYASLERTCDELKASNSSYASLKESRAVLEQSYIQLQMSHIQLEQNYSAAETGQAEADAVLKECLLQKEKLVERCSELEQKLASLNVQQGATGSEHSTKTDSRLVEPEGVIEQMRKDAEASETRFSKFKALAGSKIKALEKELEELKHHSEEVIELRNKMAELEEEKGNLQLQLLDSEEVKPVHLDKIEKPSESEQLIDALRKENVELASRNSLLEASVCEKTDQAAEELNVKLQIEKQLMALSADLNAKLEQVSRLGIELQNKEESLLQSQESLRCSEVRLTELVSEMRVKRDEIDRLTKGMNEKELSIANMTLELRDALAASNHLKCELAEKSDAAESFASSLRVKEEGMQTLQRELTLQKEMLDELRADIEAKSEHMKKLEVQIVQQEQSLTAKNVKISELQKDNELQMIELESVKQKLESELFSKVASKDEALDNLKVEFLSKCRQVENLEQDIAHQNVIIESFREELSSKNEEILNLVTASERQIAEISSVRHAVESRVRTELELLQSENLKYVSTISNLEEEMSRLSKLLEASSSECEAAKSSVNVILDRENHCKSIIQDLERQLAENEVLMKCVEQEKLLAVSSLNEKITAQTEQMAIHITELEQLKNTESTSTAASDLIQNEIRDKDDKIRSLLQQLNEKDAEASSSAAEYNAALSSRSLEIEKLTLELVETKNNLSKVEFDTVEKQRKLVEMEYQLDNLQTSLKVSSETLERDRSSFLTREAELLSSIDTMKLKLVSAAEDAELLHRRCEEAEQVREALEKKFAHSETKIASLSENLQEEEAQLVAVTLELEKWKSDAELMRLQVDIEKQQALSSKEEEISRLNDSLRERETQLKKYIAVIKKLKLQLQEEKAKVEEAEKSMELKADTSVSDPATDMQKSLVESNDYHLLIEELQLKVSELSEKLNEKDVEMLSQVGSSEKLCIELRAAAQDAISRCEITQTELAQVLLNRSEEKNSSSLQINEQHQRSELLIQENQHLLEKLRTCESCNTDLEAQIKKLLGLNLTLKQEAESLSSMVQGVGQMDAELQQVSMQMDRWRQLAEESEYALKDLSLKFEMESQTLVDENRLLKMDIERLSAEVEMLRHLLEANDVDNSHLKTQLIDLISGRDSLSKTLEECAFEKKLLENNNEKLSADILRLEEDLNYAKETLINASHEYEQLSKTARDGAEALENVKSDSLNLDSERLEIAKVEEECKLKEAAVEKLQLQLENLQMNSSETAHRHTEMYGQLEKQFADLQSKFAGTKHEWEKEKETLTSKLKYRECSDDSVKLHNESLVQENANVVAQLTKANVSNAALEELLKDLTSRHENSVIAFEQIQKGLEMEKVKIEVELGKVCERAAKAESSVQLLRAELETERERFSQREAELEGSSEELQLEVARLSQDLESVDDRCRNLYQENEKLKFEIQHFASDKEQAVLAMRAEGQKREKELLSQIDVLNEEIDKLNLEMEKLNDEQTVGRESMDKKYVELSRQYEMLNSDISTYQDIVNDLKSKNAQLEQQLRQTLADQDSLVSSLDLTRAEQQHLLHDKQICEDEIRTLQSREAAICEEVDELKQKLDEFGNTEEELEETQNVLFSMQAENADLKNRIDALEKRNAELTVIESEATALQDKYMSVLQDNNALIRQSKEMYEKLRSGGGMITEQLQTSSSDTVGGETDALLKEINSLKAELSSNKAVHQSKLQLKIDENNQLRQQLADIEAIKVDGSKPSKASESELLRSELKQLQARYEQCRAKLAAVQSKVRSDPGRKSVKSQQADVLDECPKVHISLVHSAAPAPSSVEPSVENKEAECTRLQSQITELVAEKESLGGRIHTAEQTVKQRETEMVHIHQQYQMLYQQFAALQIHYAALEQRLQASPPTSQQVSKTQEGSRNIPEDATVVATITQRMQALQRQMEKSADENNELRKQLLAESQARVRSDEILNETREQLQIQQQLLARGVDQRTINIEDSDDREYDQPKMASVLANPRDVQQLYRVIRQWWQSSSILLGRTLRGQPRVRKSFLAYIFLLHIYVLFACILTGV